MIRIQYVKALCVLGLSATTTWGVLALDVKDGKSDEPACIWNDSRGITDITNTGFPTVGAPLHPSEALTSSRQTFEESVPFPGITDVTNTRVASSQVGKNVPTPVKVFVDDQSYSDEDGPKTTLRFNKVPEEYYDNIKVRERMTTDYQGRLAISCFSLESIPNYISKDGIKLQHKMAQGEYDEVIEECHKIIAENSLWWESKPWIEGGERNHWKLTEAQRLLANGYELKGEWGKAKRAYEVLLGVSSKDYMWAMARCAYEEMRNSDKKTSESSQLMCLDCFLRGELDRLMQERENICKLKELLQRDGRHGDMAEMNEWNREFYPLRRTWKRVWLFRDRVARIFCPELYYVSSITPREGVKLFSALQKDSFEELLISFKEQIDVFNGKHNSFMEQDLRDLELLHGISYDYSPNGYSYGDEARCNFLDVPGDRIEESGREQPFIFVENED